MLTITSLFENTVARYPDRPAIVCGELALTYAEWDRRVRRLAQALFDLGVRQMDRVGILQKTSEATPTAFMACQLLGAVAVPMNFRLSANEAAFILRDAGARALVYDESMQPVIGKIEQALPDLGLFVRVGGEAPLPAHHHDFEALIAAACELNAPLPQLKPE
ncbi:MAG: AMP-binding protein, partial [Burkholderiales bacterium]|nr:AMP-binding protein [Burkholderiales bacterium]